MNIKAFYNEIDLYCCAWLSNLMDAGLITPGVICDKSIEDILPDELIGYHRVHMFAGIGVWDYALNLAGWGDSEVWTGSCPCQPFSAAGKGAGFADERHQWPNFLHLIKECRPSKVFGEQVAAATDWLGLVRCDMEAVGYAMGAMPIEAASAGADHFRDRYFFVADDDQQRASAERQQRSGQQRGPSGDSQDSDRPLSVRASERRGGSKDSSRANGRNGIEVDGNQSLVNDPSLGWGEGWTEHEFRSRGFTAAVASIEDCQYVECPDGKWRRLPPPRVRWLGNGIAARVSKLRAIGNAIDPRPAAEFIRAAA